MHNLTKVVNERLHYVQTIAGCGFTSVKVSLGLVSVQCAGLRGVRFLE